MQAAALAHDEAERLRCLQGLAVLDTPAEPVFEQITQLAAELCGVPISLVSLIDAERQWFKSRLGLEGVSETPRDLAFCAHTILGDGLMEVPDARDDPRFADNPLVGGAPGIRFYAGTPLTLAGGVRVGTLCVIDRVPRRLDELQRRALAGLGRLVATALEERRRRLGLQQELEATEASYRLIVEGQTELVSLAAADGQLRYVNAAYARFFGSTPGEMIGRNLLDFVADHDRDDVAAHLRRLVAAGVPAGGINRMRSAGGEERWVAWTNQVIAAEGGRPASIHSVGRDITQQRLAEQALADNELRNRLAYRSTPAMLHSIDTQGRLIEVSDTWLHTLGYRREEVEGRRSVDFLTPASRELALREVLPAFFATGRSDDVAYQMQRKDGSVIDVLMSAILERDAQGRPARSLAVVEDVTERKATAASLSDTTHMLQLVLDSLPARISYWDIDSRNRFANKAFLEWFGVSQAQISGRHVREVLGAEWFEQLAPIIADGLAGRHRQLELSTVSADGLRRDQDLQFTPDRRDGEVRGLFVLALDLTARRAAERGLADREMRLKLLLDGVRDYAIYMLDTGGRVETWNAVAERDKGYRAEEIIGRHFGIFFTPEDVAAGTPEAELAQAARDGRFETEGWRLRRDGSRYWAGVLLSAIRDEQGALIGYAKITRDLSEPRRQQALLVRAVELAPCAMLMVNAQGLIVMVNAQAEGAFGYTRAELLGRPLEMLIPPHLEAAHRRLREGFMANPAARAMRAGRELRARRKNGQEFPIEIGLSPIDSADGPGTLAAIFDITERRRQQALTEQALAEKETLLKEVYHRVKNNLQVVQSLLNLQRLALPEGEARAAIDDSVQRVRAMALVHEKLYQSGNLAAVALPVYTRDLVAQLAEAHGVDRRRIQLHLDIDDCHTGLDNAVPFGLLMTELITNCMKHAFPGGRTGDVWVRLQRCEGGALLSVADNGVGFAVAPEPGAGLQSASMGLQLAEGLASQLGGVIEARNEGGARLSALLTRL